MSEKPNKTVYTRTIDASDYLSTESADDAVEIPTTLGALRASTQRLRELEELERQTKEAAAELRRSIAHEGEA